MTREDIERMEHERLSPLAAFASDSKGRAEHEKADPYRTCYMRDRDRILHCKAFRRLSHKTQVFIAAEGDHYRTRLTHTLEVAQISRSVAVSLGLSESLTEAIALGHDLGHTPFGHTGELALRKCISKDPKLDPRSSEAYGLFAHNVQSRRVVEVLEKNGAGLNLTLEVRDGIECHTGPKRAMTLEGRIVAICDRIAYVNHDIDDSVRGGIITEEMLPTSARELLGNSHSQRISTLVRDLVKTSSETGDIAQSPELKEAMDELRSYLFKHVYTASDAKGEEPKAFEVVCMLYRHFMEHPDQLPRECVEVAKGDVQRAVVDYVAGMTDRYALYMFSELFVPRRWHK